MFTYENMARIIFQMTEEQRKQEVVVIPEGHGVSFVITHLVKNENDGSYQVILK